MAKKPTPTEQKVEETNPAPSSEAPVTAPAQPWAKPVSAAVTTEEPSKAPDTPAPAADASQAPVSADNAQNEQVPATDEQAPGGDGEEIVREPTEEELAEQDEIREKLTSLSEDERDEFEAHMHLVGKQKLDEIIRSRNARSMSALMVDGNEHFGTKVRQAQEE